MNKFQSLRKSIPLGVVLIAVFYLYGAIVLLLTLFANPIGASRGLSASYALSSAADAWILPIVAISALLISFGLFTRSRWGYFFSIAYFLYFGGVSLWLILQSVRQPYLGNFIWSVMVLLYLAWKRKYFLATQVTSTRPLL